MNFYPTPEPDADRRGCVIATLNSAIRCSHSVAPLWNMVVRFGFFFLVTQLLTLKGHLERERELVHTDGLTGVMNVRTYLALTSYVRLLDSSIRS